MNGPRLSTSDGRGDRDPPRFGSGSRARSGAASRPSPAGSRHGAPGSLTPTHWPARSRVRANPHTTPFSRGSATRSRSARRAGPRGSRGDRLRGPRRPGGARGDRPSRRSAADPCGARRGRRRRHRVRCPRGDQADRVGLRADRATRSGWSRCDSGRGSASRLLARGSTEADAERRIAAQHGLAERLNRQPPASSTRAAHRKRHRTW